MPCIPGVCMTVNKISIKDSVIEARIQEEMVLQRLYGQKEVIESNLSLCNDDTPLHQKLLKNLDHVNHEIMQFKSDRTTV